MKIIKEKISRKELQEIAKRIYGKLVKAIVDVEKQIMAIDADLHSDLFELLVKEENCEPKDLWGINLYPNANGADFIEFDSMMNVRPGLGNKTRGVEKKELRNKIRDVVNKLVQP